MVEGWDTYPSDGNSWFADTSTIDTDSDNDSLLDTSGYDVSEYQVFQEIIESANIQMETYNQESVMMSQFY